MVVEYFPPRSHFILLTLKNLVLGTYGQRSYAQRGEDITIAYLLQDVRHGVYVDVGAHHPWRGSNTYLLHKRGWHGVNIDPNANAIALFKVFRPRDSNVACGVAAEEGTLPFWMFSDPAFNTFDKQDAERLKKKHWIHFLKETPVRVRPLAAILAEHKVGDIHFLNVDAEGLDLEVLESNDWERWRPLVIAVEDRSFDPSNPGVSPAHRLLTGKGYELYATTHGTLIFRRA